jgi:biotin carboxyl carrier protein
VVPAAVALLAVCGCVAVSGLAAVGVSDDLRSSVEDLFGVGEEEAVVVSAARSGRVASVLVAAGDDVDEGDELLVLAPAAAPRLGSEAQRLLEEAWDLLDEIAAGKSNASPEQLLALRDSVQEDAATAASSLREARAEGLDEAQVDELAVRAELAQARLRIADVRLALVDGSISEDDVRAVESALQLAQDQLSAAGAEGEQFTVRATVAATVDEVLVDEDDRVIEGQALVRLSPHED